MSPNKEKIFMTEISTLTNIVFPYPFIKCCFKQHRKYKVPWSKGLGCRWNPVWWKFEGFQNSGKKWKPTLFPWIVWKKYLHGVTVLWDILIFNLIFKHLLHLFLGYCVLNFVFILFSSKAIFSGIHKSQIVGQR